LLASIDALDFVLWKCSIPIEDHGPQPEATLSSIRFDHPDDRLRFLNPARTISEYFTESVVPYTIHILVQLPDPGESKFIMMFLLNKLNCKSKTLKERKKFNAEIIVKPQVLPPGMQDMAEQGIAYSRPPTADATIPVTLFHCIFRQFVDGCKNHQPTREGKQRFGSGIVGRNV